MHPWSRVMPRSAARPPAIGSAKKIRRTGEASSSAAQPPKIFAEPTTIDALLRMQEIIFAADVQDYVNWKLHNAQSTRKTLSNLVGHIQAAMRHSFQCSAEQPAPQGIPFRVLIGWLLFKCDSHSASVVNAKQLLYDLAKDEHRVFRVSKMVEKTDELNQDEMHPERQIDIEVLHECLQLL